MKAKGKTKKQRESDNELHFWKEIFGDSFYVGYGDKNRKLGESDYIKVRHIDVVYAFKYWLINQEDAETTFNDGIIKWIPFEEVEEKKVEEIDPLEQLAVYLVKHWKGAANK